MDDNRVKDGQPKSLATLKLSSLLLTLVLVIPIVITLSGCTSGSSGLPSANIPPTPTASTQTQKTGPPFDLLRQAHQAMQGVTSYHVTIDNSLDTNTVEMNDTAAGIGQPPQREILFEADVAPPVARYGPSKDSTFSQMLAIGKDRYVHSQTLGYQKSWDSGSTWYYWSNTGGLNNPQEYINYTLDKASCATIVGEEQVDSVDTIHARYNLTSDELGNRSTGGYFAYVRDIWIEKATHYVRRLQTHQVINSYAPCEQALTWNSHTLAYSTGTLSYSKHNVPISPPIKWNGR